MLVNIIGISVYAESARNEFPFGQSQRRNHFPYTLIQRESI